MVKAKAQRAKVWKSPNALVIKMVSRLQVGDYIQWESKYEQRLEEPSQVIEIKENDVSKEVTVLGPGDAQGRNSHYHFRYVYGAYEVIVYFNSPTDKGEKDRGALHFLSIVTGR